MHTCTCIICFNYDPLILIVFIVDKVEREGIKRWSVTQSTGGRLDTFDARETATVWSTAKSKE